MSSIQRSPCVRLFPYGVRLLPIVATVLMVGGVAAPARAESLCDSSVTNCRTHLLSLIDNETVGIDVAFWFMEDQRYVSHIVNRWNAGVPVRLIVDPRANATYTMNKTSLDAFRSAGIPMRYKVGGGIMHWKMMLFAGQNTVEFGSANFSDNAFVPVSPYTNYVGETIYYADDPVVVNSFKTKYDNLWTDTSNYANYANVTSTARTYPTYTISADLNFPPGQDYASRAVSRYKAETQKLDVIMYRVTDRRHTDGIIAAWQRGVPVRYLGETKEYRDATRIWVSWNMDRIYAAGIPMRVRGNEGQNHEKLVLLYGQGMTIFGSSNWTGPSANSQQEHNYFTTKSWIFQWFVDQFERKWNNSNPLDAVESTPFVPLPPDKPVSQSPASAATGVATTGVTLTWYGGPWAHVYDVYFGTTPDPPLFAADQALGPSQSKTQSQHLALPPLTPGTTYYWKIVSKTMAPRTATGAVWSFTTAGTAPPPPPPGTATSVMWAANVPAANLHGNWTQLADSTAAGGTALWNTNKGAAKISPALASPTNYFETTFSANSGTPYHVWVRLRAENNSLSNDSVHLQFNDSVTSSGDATMRIGSTSSAEVVLQNGSGDPGDTGWGWADNGWGSLGTQVYFAASGTHTIRVQQREDGAIIDQILISADSYLSTPPGPRDNDATILASTDGASPPPPPPSPSSSASTIVLWTAGTPANAIHGNWSVLADSTAAGGSALWNPNGGQAKISPALASPANYAELTFNAPANTAYHLWVRLRAQNNSVSNDSVHVQFNDSVTSGGSPTMQIGTTGSAEVILQNGTSDTGDHSWGWADNGWGTLGDTVSFATTGSHTLRIQQREDGAIVDQIVLSPDTYLTSPPGPGDDDTTILPAQP